MAANMDMVADFNTRFYNLEGIHYNERKKNFYKLLHSVDPNTLAQIDIEPRNYLEKIFYVDVLIHSKRIDKLLEILKEGNGVLVSRILKQKWFFKEAFNEISERDIVNEFLPTISFALRMKVLKKMALSFSEERMDNIFDCVLERYGMFIAVQFLFSCSSTKIIDVLRHNELILSSEQLKRVLARDVSLIKVYFEEYQKNKKMKFHDQDFLSYLVLKYPNLYFELAPYVEDFPKVGRRTTKSLLKLTDQEEILKDLNKVKNKFNLSAITRQVKNFDKHYLYKLLPSDKTALGHFVNSNTISTFLKKYPWKNRWNIFSVAYEKAYNEDVQNCLKLINWQLTRVFPRDEIIMKWGEILYKENNSDATFLEYFEPKKGFLLIKQKLNVTSDAYDRSKLLCSSIRSCHTYKNYDVYEDVLKYIYARHRNEEANIRFELLNEISRNIDYELTTEAFWLYINQLIDISRVKHESLPYKNIAQYLTYLLKKNPSTVDQAFKQFVKDCVPWNFYNNYFREPKIKGDVMKHVIKHLDVIDDPIKRQGATVKFIDEIVTFNMDNRDLWINLNEFPRIIETFRSVLEAEVFNDEEVTCIANLIKYNYCGGCQGYLKVYEDGQLLNIVKHIAASKHFPQLSNALYIAVKKPRASAFQTDLLDFYFTWYLPHYPGCFKRQQVNYFITADPETFAKYFDNMLDIECRHNSVLDYPVIKRFSHLLLDKKLITFLIAEISRTDSLPSMKLELIEKLSKIMTTDDFINISSTYIPQKMKLDDMNEEQKQLFELQCAIVKALRNLDELQKTVSLLKTFCQGDYLQASIPSMYKVVYRSSEEQTISFINVLADRGVSTRKHAVHLSFVVLPQTTAIDIFNAIATEETNVSAKKYLLQGVLKYYLKNPSEHLLGIVIKSLAFVDKNDTELISTLTDAIANVQWLFKPVFFEHVWNFLGDMEKKEVLVTAYRIKLLSTVNEYDIAFFLKIKDNVCRNIIKQYFFSDNVTILVTMYDFVAKYLLAYKDDDHFNFVFHLLSIYKELHWQSHEKDKLKCIFEFFNRVHQEYAHQDADFLRLFKTYWEQVFSHEQCFSEYVVLQLMVLYNENTVIESFSKEVSKFFRELNLEYGPYIDDLLLDCINQFFSNRGVLKIQSFTPVGLAYHMLKFDLSELNCTIASLLIRGAQKNEIYWEIVAMLKSFDSSSVRIHCNTLFKW